MSNLLFRINTDNKDVRKIDTFSLIGFETPNRIENEVAGSTITISFAADGTLSSDVATMTLWKGSTQIATIVTGYNLITGTNTQSYTLPASADGGNYYIKIDITSRTSWYFYSDIFSIGSYNKYYALETSTAEINFNFGLVSKSITLQWKGDLVNVGEISEIAGDDLNFQSSNLNIQLKNENNYWNNILDEYDTRFIYGTEAELIGIDGLSERRYRVVNWTFEIGVIIFELSDRSGIFLEEPLNGVDQITENRYPDAPTESIKNYIPYTFGNFRKSGLVADDGHNTIRAYRVNDGTGTLNYVLGKTAFPVITFAAGNRNVYLPDGTEVSSSCTNTLHSDDINYINYTATVEDYLDVNFTTSTIAIPYGTRDILESLDDLFTGYNFSYDTLFEYFDVEHFRYDDEYYIAKWHYTIAENKTATEVLNEICRTLGLEYYVNGNFEIVFIAFNPATATTTKAFQEGEIKEYNMSVDFDKMFNSVNYKTAYEPKDSSFSLSTKYINREGLRNWVNEKQKTIEYKGFFFERNNVGTNQFHRSHVPTKKILMEFCEPVRNVVIKIDLEKVDLPASLKLHPLDIIEFPITDGRALSTGVRKYQIRSISKNYNNNFAIINLRDIDFVDDFQNKQTVLINSNDVDGSELYWNDAVNGYIDIQGDNVVHSTSQKRYGTSSLYFQRSRTAHLIIGSALDRTGLDFMNTTNTPDFTLELQFRYNGLGSDEYLYNQAVDVNNVVTLSKAPGNGMQFFIVVGGTTVMNMVTAAILVNSWHDIVVVRNGSFWGLYVDGLQKAYAFSSSSYQFNAAAYLGKYSLSTYGTFDGYMDGFEINYDNKYSLSPVSGLSDSYTPLTKQQGFFKQT